MTKKNFIENRKAVMVVLAVVAVLAIAVGVGLQFAKPSMQSSAAETNVPTTEKIDTVVKALYGDADGNGKVEAADARLALRASVGLDEIEKGTQQFKNTDVDEDGAITAADARVILRVAVGLEKETKTEEESTTLPVEESTTLPIEESTTVPEERTTQANYSTTEKGHDDTTYYQLETVTDPITLPFKPTEIHTNETTTEEVVVTQPGDVTFIYDPETTTKELREETYPETTKIGDGVNTCDQCGWPKGHGIGYCNIFLSDVKCPNCEVFCNAGECHHCTAENKYGKDKPNPYA